MSSTFDQSIDIVGYLRLFWRRRGIIILSAVSVVSGTLIMLSRMPPIYESQVTLRIQESRPLTKDLEKLRVGAPNEPWDWRIHEQRLALLTEQVKGRVFLGRLVQRLGMTEDPNVRARAAAQAERRPDIGADELAVRMLVGQLRSNIEIELLGDGLYGIRVADLDASRSHLLAQSIAGLLIDMDQEAAYEQTQRSLQFGLEQLQRYKDRVQESEEALQIVKSDIIRDRFPRLVHAENLPLAEDLYRQVQRSANGAADRLGQRRAEVRDLLSDDAAALRTEAGVAEAQGRITAKLRETIVSRLSENEDGPSRWPPKGDEYEFWRRDFLRSLENRAKILYARLGSDAPQRIALYVFARVDAEAHSQVEDFLGQEIATFKVLAQSQPKREIEIKRLENELEVKEQLTQSFREQLVATEVSQAVEIRNLGQRMDVLNPAELPLSPSRPDKMKILLGAILIGPFLGAAIAFGVDALDPTLRSLSDYRRVVPEPILGTTPLLRRLEPRHRGIRRIWVPAAVIAIVILTATYFVMRSTEPNVAEADGADADALVQPQDAEQ